MYQYINPTTAQNNVKNRPRKRERLFSHIEKTPPVVFDQFINGEWVVIGTNRSLMPGFQARISQTQRTLL